MLWGGMLTNQGKKVGGHAVYLENAEAIVLEKCAALDAAAFLTPNVLVGVKERGRRRIGRAGDVGNADR